MLLKRCMYKTDIGGWKGGCGGGSKNRILGNYPYITIVFKAKCYDSDRIENNK